MYRAGGREWRWNCDEQPRLHARGGRRQGRGPGLVSQGPRTGSGSATAEGLARLEKVPDRARPEKNLTSGFARLQTPRGRGATYCRSGRASSGPNSVRQRREIRRGGTFLPGTVRPASSASPGRVLIVQIEPHEQLHGVKFADHWPRAAMVGSNAPYLGRTRFESTCCRPNSEVGGARGRRDTSLVVAAPGERADSSTGDSGCAAHLRCRIIGESDKGIPRSVAVPRTTAPGWPGRRPGFATHPEGTRNCLRRCAAHSLPRPLPIHGATRVMRPPLQRPGSAARRRGWSQCRSG